MRRSTVPWNASATSCADEPSEGAPRFCWLENDEDGYHTSPQYRPVACDHPCYLWCECSMQIAMSRWRVWPKASNVVPSGTLDQLVVCPHHPDQLRRPTARPGALHADILEHALTWNVFRTLELLPPAFSSVSTGTAAERADT
jgi:hypothetical protein